LKPPCGQPICPAGFGRCPCLEAGFKGEAAAPDERAEKAA